MNRITLSPRIRMTPFHDSTVAAGLSDISVYNKMVMPTSYGDLKAEYDRLINGVAIWDVSVERQVEVVGPDADQCAQYLTARDLTNMKQGQGKYVAMCDHEGRILNDPVLMKLSGDRYWFSLADNDMLLWCRAIAAERGFDVTVHEPDVSPLAVQGPKGRRPHCRAVWRGGARTQVLLVHRDRTGRHPIGVVPQRLEQAGRIRAVPAGRQSR